MDVISPSPDGANAMRDLDQAITSDWPQHPFPLPGPRGSGTRVVIRQSLLNEIHRHGQSRTDVEVCGVLVGNGYQDAEGAFLYVEASIRGEHASHQLAQVTFTSETWCHIQEVMDREHSGRRIVGWYHTHPGFGIFLSPMDLFIHENFFGDPEQLALVYDPLGGDEGIFVWRAGAPTREPVLVEADAPNDRDVASPITRHLPALTAAAMAEPGMGLRIERIEQQQRVLQIGLLLVALIAVAWPVGFGWLQSRLGDSDRPTVLPPDESGRREPPMRRSLRDPPSASHTPQFEHRQVPRTRPGPDDVAPTDDTPTVKPSSKPSSDAATDDLKNPATDPDPQT